MNVSKIIQFRLLKQDLPDFNFDSNYWFDIIDASNINDRIHDIEFVSKIISEELREWKKYPTPTDVIERINFGSICNLWYYKENLLGWHWTNNDWITTDWKTPYQKLKSNEIYIGGAFLSRRYKPSASSSLYFYRQGFEFSLKTQNKNTMYLYSDFWNRASAQLSYKCGFTKYNFIK